MLTVAVNVYFIIYKGFKRKIDGESLSDKMGDGYISLTAWGFGLLMGIIMYLVFVRWLKKYHENWQTNQEHEEKREEARSVVIDTTSNGRVKNFWNKVRVWWRNMFSKNLHIGVLEDEYINSIHESAEKFDDKTEHTFSFVQVFTACMDSFSHGANDVANSIGPFAAVWSIYDTEKVSSKADVPVWILALGGAGIVCGLALYGAKMIKALGIKISKITPSRGYNIELSSSLVVIIASVYGIPVSTTHCQVGSTAGVALVDGYQQTGDIKKSINGLNGWVMLRVLFGMFATMIFVASVSGGLYAYGVYSPNELGY
jgi:sodium-dependent phosphate transporter